MGFDLLVAGGTDNRLFADDLASCVVEVRVEQTLDQPTQFAIRFQDDIENGKLKKAGVAQLQLGELVTIAVDGGNDRYVCLCRGPILEHESKITQGGPGSSFTIHGVDRRDELGREVREQNWSGRAADVARLLLVAVYPISDIQQTEQVYDLNGSSLTQRANDLDFLTRTAADNGFHFWIGYSGVAELPSGSLSVIETAYWKSSPPLQDAAPAGLPALTLTSDSLTLRYNVPRDQCANLTKFELATDGTRPTSARTTTRNLTDGGDERVDVTDQAAPMAAGGQGLAQRAPARQLATRPQGNAQDARRRNQAALREAGFFVHADVSTTRHLLHGVLEPHQVVAVEGVGGANGRTPFRVSQVTHVINGIGHFMDARIETNVQLPNG